MKKIKPSHDDSMWKGAPGTSFGKAKDLRENMTKAEKILWEKLRNNQLEGIKFRRQHPVNFYIADFYCHKYRLVIEIDGGYHESEDQKRKDRERTQMLADNGLTVIRFTNEEVERNLNDVLNRIRNVVEELKK